MQSLISAILAGSCLASIAHAGEPEAEFHGFKSVEDRAGLLDRLGRLYGDPRSPLPLESERIEYNIYSRGVRAGSATFTLSVAESDGRPVYKASLRVELPAGRVREDFAEIDAAGLFPLKFETRWRAGGETWVDAILWDCAGARAFFQGALMRDNEVERVRYRLERRLGKDIPADALDPLSAILIERIRHLRARGSVEARTVPIVEGSEAAETGVFEPADAGVKSAGSGGLAVFNHSRGRDSKNAIAMRFVLDMDKRAAPARIEGTYRGWPFRLELSKYEPLM